MTTTTTTVRKFPIFRHYSDGEGTRKASIAIFDDGDERYGQFRISVSHECWTGADWLPIHQEDNAYSLEEAFATASRIRDDFGWVAG